MPADWRIEHWPRCGFHAFLSHCAEDRERLVLPVQKLLRERDILSWVDWHHYPSGRDPSEALREELLRCRHVVFLITPAMLRQGRGWTAMENAYTGLVQQVLRFGGIEIAHVALPLFFVDRSDGRPARSVWRTLVDRGVFYDSRSRAKPRMALWAAERITEFVLREQFWGQAVGERIEADAELRAAFSRDRNLFRRIIAAEPSPISLVSE